MKKNNSLVYISYAILFVASITIIGIAATYAFVSGNESNSFGSYPVTSSVDCIDLSYSENGAISLTNQYPVTDDVGGTKAPVTVTVRNTCSNQISYYLLLTTLTKSGINYMNDNQVKIKVFKGDTNIIPAKMVSTLPGLSSGNIYTYLTNDLKTRTNVSSYTPRASYYLASSATSYTVNGGATDTFTVRLWIDYNEGTGGNNSTQGKSFTAAISAIVG